MGGDEGKICEVGDVDVWMEMEEKNEMKRTGEMEL